MSVELPLAISCGDPSGVGPEIVAAAWLLREPSASAPFFVLGDARLTADRAKQAGMTMAVVECDPQDALGHFQRALPVVPIKNILSDRPGVPVAANAKAIIEAIDRGVDAIRDGLAAGLVTCPISKKTLYDAGFEYPGHTEYLGHLAKTKFSVDALPVMMIAGPGLRTVPVTIHMPLSAVSSALSTSGIVDVARIADASLRGHFGISAPRLAIAGLNPHAGEGGALGSEDQQVIAPAIQQLKDDGIDARGPLPADTMFHQRARETYDAAICMYHDQALIPAKMLGFDEAVNVTLGLPFIRTSPDHGTAFDIAGKGIARPDSLIAAINMAASMARHNAKSKA